jgi:hypothetical protein
MNSTEVRLAALVAAGLTIVAASCTGGLPPTGSVPVPDASPALEAAVPADADETIPFPCSLGTTMAVVESKIFQGPKCVTCHGRVTLFPTNLDLASASLATRVVDKPSSSDPMKGKCPGRVLVPRDNPTQGLFVQKVEASPPCGDQMPQGMFPLTDDEISCIKMWATLAARAAAGN